MSGYKLPRHSECYPEVFSATSGNSLIPRGMIFVTNGVPYARMCTMHVLAYRALHACYVHVCTCEYSPILARRIGFWRYLYSQSSRSEATESERVSYSSGGDAPRPL